MLKVNVTYDKDAYYISYIADDNRELAVYDIKNHKIDLRVCEPYVGKEFILTNIYLNGIQSKSYHARLLGIDGDMWLNYVIEGAVED